MDNTPAHFSPLKAHTALILVLIVPLFSLAITQVGTLTWSDYVRSTALLVGLGCFWWRDRFSQGPVVLAILLMIVTAQSSPATIGSGSVYWLIWGGVTCATAVVFRASLHTRLSLLDWTGIGVGLFVFMLSGSAGYLFGLEDLWPGSLQWLFYPMLWILLVHWIPSMEGHRLWVKRGLLGLLVVTCAAGGGRTGTAFYQFLAGKRAEGEGDFEKARTYYERSAEGSRDLGLKALYGKSRLALARSFTELGERQRAEAALGLENWQRTIQPEEWAGPTGGNLFKSVSCWKDLWFRKGEVEIRVYARGQSAKGVWPRMRVSLGGRLLGEAAVTSRKFRPYVFSTAVEAGERRLEIAFLNGFWQPGVGYRWIFIGKADVRYEE